MGTEIERKFLVADPSVVDGLTGSVIRQGYLSREPGRTVRVRRRGDRAYVTIKGANVGARRSEWEYEIPAPTRTRCWPCATARSSTRPATSSMSPGGPGRSTCSAARTTGLVMAEVELDAEDAVVEAPGLGRPRSHRRSPLLQRQPDPSPDGHAPTADGRAPRSRPVGRRSCRSGRRRRARRARSGPRRGLRDPRRRRTGRASRAARASPARWKSSRTPPRGDPANERSRWRMLIRMPIAVIHCHGPFDAPPDDVRDGHAHVAPSRTGRRGRRRRSRRRRSRRRGRRTGAGTGVSDGRGGSESAGVGMRPRYAGRRSRARS